VGLGSGKRRDWKSDRKRDGMWKSDRKRDGMVKSDGKSDGMPENDAKKDEDWDGLGNTTGYSYFYKKTRDNTTFVCRMISLCFTNCTPRGLEKETRMPYYCV